jgi:hypothetical protein
VVVLMMLIISLASFAVCQVRGSTGRLLNHSKPSIKHGLAADRALFGGGRFVCGTPPAGCILLPFCSLSGIRENCVSSSCCMYY